MANTDQENAAEIAELIADYRAGEIPTPTTAHVEKWAKQFDSGDRSAILSGTHRFMSKSYMSRAAAEKWLGFLLSTKELTGKDPAAWLKKANFIRGQNHGNSQKELLRLADDVIKEKTGFTLRECGAADGAHVYLDDCVFTGWTVINDLKSWIAKYKGPPAKLHVFTAGTYRSGEHWASKVLKPLAKEKGLALDFWHAMSFSNFKDDHGADAEVLRAAVLPPDPAVKAYFDSLDASGRWFRRPADKYPKDHLFASEEQRQVLESAFLKVGVKLRKAAANPSKSVRPLGFQSLESLGFGATFFTYRNAPNNLPLALWWGDQSYSKTSSLGMWYPLLPRKTNA